jgi:hypothetical protein
LRDLSPEGPVAVIAALCAEHIAAKGLKRIDWPAPAARAEHLDLVLRMRQRLLQAGALKPPRVHVPDTCGAAAPRLRAAVAALGGEAAPGERGATHVVEPFADPDDGKHYLRTLELSPTGEARVHWWYLPPSYDEWVPGASAPEEVAPPARPPRGRPWRVHPRWVLDSQAFNEWMAEEDYLPEGFEAEAEAAEAAAAGGARAPKRARAERRGGPAAEVAPGPGAPAGPGALRRAAAGPARARVAPDGPAAVADVSRGQRAEGEGVPRAWPAAGAPPALPRALPPRAAWLAPGAIAERERAELPELFAPPGAGAAAVAAADALYVAVRDHVAALAAAEPGRRLELAEAARDLDVGADYARRVFEALERWGAANDAVAGPPRRVAGGDAAPPAGAAALLRPRARPPTPAEAAEAAARGGGAALVRRGAFRRAAPQPAALAVGARHVCASTGADCTALRYHCVSKRHPDLDLSPAAYADGCFPPGLAARDFVRVAAADAVPDASGWSDQETLLLLEAVEARGDEWGAVAAHVGGGRTALQCLTRFVTMPIHDAFLSAPAESAEGGESGEEEPLPFGEEANPVAALLAVLTSAVGPRVAASAARAALETIAAAGGEDGAAPVPRALALRAARAGLAAAGARAGELADAERREAARTVIVACELQAQRVGARERHNARLEEALAAEAGRTRARGDAARAALDALKAAGAPVPPAAAPMPPLAGAPL